MQHRIREGILAIFAGLSLLLLTAGHVYAQSEPQKPADKGADTYAEAVDDPLPAIFPHLETDRLWLTGQANFIFQTHPPFHAAYTGKNSLDPNYEKATSRVLTLYTGVRLDNSTEFLLDVEEAGGAALSTGLGLAGNTDLDIVRNPSLSKAPYPARVRPRRCGGSHQRHLQRSSDLSCRWRSRLSAG